MSASGREVVLVAGVRTAVGDFGGALKDHAPTALAAMVVREVLARAQVAPAEVGHVVFGNVIQTEPRDMYLARVAAIDGGVPQEVPALTLNRLCGSGMQAIVSAAQAIALGDCEIAVAGGAENMSRSPYSVPAARWGQRMGDEALVDWMLGALTDPFDRQHMGITAERIAQRWGFDRDTQDAYAAESHRRAAVAQAEGRFKAQILPVELKSKKGTVMFDLDEHVRGDTTAEELGRLRAVFMKDGGTVTAGNASPLNDAAAAVVLMSRAEADRRGVAPMARLAGYGHAGVDPAIMGIGPVPAVRNALTRAGVKVDDLDVIESNEAFAVQACAVSKDLGFDPAKVNPNGGAIALGHPVGATGTIISVKALHELQRTGKRWALATMCIGGGQGIATVWERLH
jgi:acetyl-CoA C-acetyltransferase